MSKLKCKIIPLQTSMRPYGPRRLRLEKFVENRHMKVTTLFVLRTRRLYPQAISLVLISIRDWVDSGATVRPERL